MLEPWLDDGDLRLYHGDALSVLEQLPAGIAQTCVTSPPYWGLRDYGTGQWTGGDEGCDHAPPPTRYSPTSTLKNDGRPNPGAKNYELQTPTPYRDACGKCGAKRVDSQLGLEATPALYVENMVNLFREVRRVLRNDGTLWLNLGDSYANNHPNPNNDDARWEKSGLAGIGSAKYRDTLKGGTARTIPKVPPGLKNKDLVGIPWRVAFALQADGWYLRSDIIWSKPNPMPESVTDRPTKAHEYLFLFSKQPKYFYDADAIREENSEGSVARFGIEPGIGSTRAWNTTDNKRDGRTDGTKGSEGFRDHVPHGRNRRSVWTIPTQPFPEAHFATYPEELVRPCILAGTSEHGECAECGAPWRRMVERGELVGKDRGGNYNGREAEIIAAKPPGSRLGMNPGVPGMAYENTTTGWAPSCSCDAPTRPQLCIDPFIGSGTTSLVARKHGRRSIGIDLSTEYLAIAAQRTRQLSLLGGSGC